MQSAKETASNVAASAKAGMDKTKATLQEKAEKMTTRDPMQKEMATQKKDLRVDEAEMRKQEAREQHAFEKHAAQTGAHTGSHMTSGTGAVPYSTTGATGHPTGNVSEGMIGSHPVVGGAGTGMGTGTGTGGTYDPSHPTVRADAPRNTYT